MNNELMCIFKVNMLSIIARFSVDRSILIDANEEFLKKGSKPALLIESKGHTLHAFVNQKYQGDPLIDSNYFALNICQFINYHRVIKSELSIIMNLSICLRIIISFFLCTIFPL